MICAPLTYMCTVKVADADKTGILDYTAVKTSEHADILLHIYTYIYEILLQYGTQQVYKLQIFPSIHTAISSYVQFVHTYSLEIFLLNYHVFTYFISQKHILPFLCMLTPTQNPIMQETAFLCMMTWQKD
jgi:hypothetical protein